MTYEEAIERLKKRICQEGVHREDKTYHFCTDECMYAEEECEIAIAIKALEKQIPKKPIIEHRKYYDTYSCPECDSYFLCKDETGFFAGKRSEFCNKCGQAIDWSDEK